MSDSVPDIFILSPFFISFAAIQKGMSALEAHVPVGFATMPLTAQLQPERTAATALLCKQSVVTHVQSS